MPRRQAIIRTRCLTRVMLACLLGLTALAGCAPRTERGESPIGDDARLIDALLTPTDLGRGWEHIDAERYNPGFIIGSPCAQYGMFSDDEVSGRAAVSLYNAASEGTVHETIVATEAGVAASAFQRDAAEADCREWKAYGDDPERLLTFYVTPIIGARVFADDTIAYSFWNEDDPTRAPFAGNRYIVRHGGLVLQFTYVVNDVAPDPQETEALVAQAVDKLPAADVTTADDLADNHGGTGSAVDLLRWPDSEEGARQHER